MTRPIGRPRNNFSSFHIVLYNCTEARKVINRLLEFSPNLRPNLRRLLEADWFTEVTATLRKQRSSTVQRSVLFLPARRYASAGLCDSDVCLSVRPSVCHTPVLCLAERKQDREMYTI